MASFFISSPAEVVVVDSRTRSGFITLPLTNSIPNRVIHFKDQYGTFSNSTLTLSTQVNEIFDDGTTSKIFSNAFTFVSLYATPSRWMVMNATQTVQQTISSLTVNQLQFGTGAGWIQFGPIQSPIISTIQINTNDGYINNGYIGNQSTINDIMFWGLQGNYNNSVLAEISTGIGTQEFLVFKGSSVSDRIRLQTTGSIVFESGVSSRLWNSNNPTTTTSNVTPAMVINTLSNVGIQTANPGATLDVAGSIRSVSVSSQQFLISSINGFTPLVPPNLTSTVSGLGNIYLSTAGGITTIDLTSTTRGLGNIYLSTGGGGGGGITTADLTSTTRGLGNIYTSTAASGIIQSDLTSTVRGLGNIYISTGGGGGFVNGQSNFFSSVSTTQLFANTLYFGLIFL